MPFWQEVEQSLSATLGSEVRLDVPSSVRGGSINQAFRVESNEGPFFVKVNGGAGLDMFKAEAEGLEELKQSESLRVPNPLAWGLSGSQAFLVLEYLELGGVGSSVAFGEGLAAMHRVTSDQFGWYRDNTIGSTEQRNTHDADWANFFAEYRLRFQLDLAAERGAAGRAMDQGYRLIERLGDFMEGYEVEASLLHGDLWSGNYAFTRAGEPTIFDPAVYYGDREADLAMTELFGGFGRDFYAAYRQAWPLDAGYSSRKKLYNLYHVLNHFNLFGGGYLSQAEAMIESLLSEVR
jgi:protein-ribulosamine 3-kinase